MRKRASFLLSVFSGIIFFGIAYTAIRILYYNAVLVIQEYFFPVIIGSFIGGGIGFWRLRSQWNRDLLEKQIAERTAELQKNNAQLIKKNNTHRETEKALRESEEKYKNLFQNIPDLIIELNDKAEITSVNRPFFENFVYTAEEVIGQPFSNYIHPDDVEQIVLMFLEAVETHVTQEHGPEIRIVDKDGKSYWFEFNANMTFDENGNYSQAFAIARNITHRMQTEDALQESEDRYRFMSDNMTDFMWIADLELKRLKFLSSSVNRMGDDVYDIFMSLDINRTMISESYQLASDELKEELRIEEETKQTRDLTEAELNRFRVLDLGFHRLDGGTTWTETVVKLQRDKNKNPIGVYGVARDINERRQAEDEMRKLISLIENSQDFICYSTIEGEVQFINSAGLKMVGLNSVDEAKKKQIFDYVPKSINPNIRQEVLPVILSNQHWLNQTRFENFQTGETFPIEINMFPIARSGSDNPAAIAIVGKNLTEHQIVEEQLRQSQKMESLGTLSGGIAHDFNNILGVIVGYSGLVLDALPKNSAERGYQEEVIKASDRATNLVNQIRSFSRTHEIELKPILIAPLIQEALKMMRAVIPSTVEINQEIASDCGYIMADATQIQQIIMNLSNNAVHAMKTTGGVLNISLFQANSTDIEYFDPELAEGNYLQLIIKDGGHGMTKRVKDRIFEPFFSTKEVNEGTGLGLSIVHGIIKSHNGLIHVNSTPGEGSEFNILLPVIEGKFVEESKMPDVLKKGKGKCHILVVDDEVSLTKYYALALGKLGYEVTPVNDGESALQLFREHPDQFDIVFTDQTMPNMTGTQMSREILSLKPEIPIILTTGFIDTVTETELNELNFSSFLTKPIKLSTLLNSINQASKNLKKKKRSKKPVPPI